MATFTSHASYLASLILIAASPAFAAPDPTVAADAMSDALRLAMRSLASEVFGLPVGSVFARTPDIEYHFVSGESVHDRTGFSFQLSTKNPLAWRFPPRTIYKAACQWVFKSPECGYTGAATSCRKTIAACRALNNIARIGCFPGCGSGGLAQ